MPSGQSNNNSSDYSYPPPAYSPPSASYPPSVSSSHSSGNHTSNRNTLQPEKPHTYEDTEQAHRQPPPQPYQQATQQPPQQPHQQPRQMQQPQQYSGTSGISTSAMSNLPLRQGGLLDTLFNSPGAADRKPLEPPPECFSRAPQNSQQPAPFSPVQIPCAGPRLENGFPMMYPGYVLSTHDIPEQDWIRFIQDIAIAAHWGTGQTMHTSSGYQTNYGSSRGLTGIMGMQRNTPQYGSSRQAAGLVDIWNTYYFHQRGINMILMHGPYPITGPNAYQGLETLSDDDDDGNESLVEYALGAIVDVRGRRRRRHDRKQARRDRRDGRFGANMRQNNPFFLVIEYRPY
ncbi:hypothetical protein BGW37DRAFT_485110 [Umbelopsis sp. PMI_123]|nr:hypothetical protein BGW37DRAFT_485110 [Umbelopsis sp. PMI_123]